MFHSDEVRTLDEFRTDAALVSGKELDLAKALIQAFGDKLRAGEIQEPISGAVAGAH